MRLEDLPPRWRTNLDKYLRRPESKFPSLSLADFADHLRIQFEDNSKAEFQFAFYMKDIGLREVAVFTEHCGYHISHFAFRESILSIVKEISLTRKAQSLINEVTS